MEFTLIFTIAYSSLVSLILLLPVGALVYKYLTVEGGNKVFAFTAFVHAVPLVPSIVALGFAAGGELNHALRVHTFTLGFLTVLDLVSHSAV
jgi:hypothetical protein